jgi:citrate synthase
METFNDNQRAGATRPGELVAPPGLKDLVVAETTIGSVRGQEGFYHYRNHDALEVARHQTFEAAAALLIDERLPTGPDEALFRAELAAGRHLDPAVMGALVELAPLVASPLAALRAAISLLVDDTPTIDLTPAERRAQVVRVAAATPTVLAAHHRLTCGSQPLAADPGLGHAADFVRMTTGTVPVPRLARAVETYMVLTADHGFNASTFTARVVTSTGAGVGAALSAAVGALSGPLHGGAPSRVLDMLDHIGDPSGTAEWAQPRLEAGLPIMGFGHAVYRADDPRSTLLREIALSLGGELVERAVEIESRMLDVLARWKPDARLVTNVEFYAAVVLHLAGLPQEMFTPTFTTSRMIGWAAHLLEQAANNKIMRPSSRYVGPPVPRLQAAGTLHHAAG